MDYGWYLKLTDLLVQRAKNNTTSIQILDIFNDDILAKLVEPNKYEENDLACVELYKKQKENSGSPVLLGYLLIYKYSFEFRFKSVEAVKFTLSKIQSEFRCRYNTSFVGDGGFSCDLYKSVNYNMGISKSELELRNLETESYPIRVSCLYDTNKFNEESKLNFEDAFTKVLKTIYFTGMQGLRDHNL